MGSFGPESYSKPLWCCFSCKRGGEVGIVGDYLRHKLYDV